MDFKYFSNFCEKKPKFLLLDRSVNEIFFVEERFKNVSESSFEMKVHLPDSGWNSPSVKMSKENRDRKDLGTPRKKRRSSRKKNVFFNYVSVSAKNSESVFSGSVQHSLFPTWKDCGSGSLLTFNVSGKDTRFLQIHFQLLENS